MIEINDKKLQSYMTISEKDVYATFEISEGKIRLRNSKSLPIQIKFPLVLDEEIAKISAMLLDGSLNKDFYNLMFCQKKDKSKVEEFSKIIEKMSGLKPKFIEFNNDAPGVVFSSKVLGIFLNMFLSLHKSDETARIPYWIWNSPKSVVVEYLKYAFAMEGSIGRYLKGTEIKFHSVDLPYLEDLKKLLKEKFNIYSNIQKYHIDEYGWKYYLTISSQDEVIKFQEIGFALDTHQTRLTELVASFKNKAWEITLVKILNIYSHNSFTLNDVCRIIPSICKRAIHQRLYDLVKLGYLHKRKVGYFLSDIGYSMAINIKDNVKFTELRTNPKENERKVFQFLLIKGESYRNEIARELKITPNTIRDTLKRLLNQNKIQLTRVDKFQRRFYTTYNNKLIV